MKIRQATKHPAPMRLASAALLCALSAFPAVAQTDLLTLTIHACTHQDSQLLDPLLEDLQALGWQKTENGKVGNIDQLSAELSTFYNMQKGLTASGIKREIDEMHAYFADPENAKHSDDPSKPAMSLHHPQTPNSFMVAYPEMGQLYCQISVSHMAFAGPWVTQVLALAAQPDAANIRHSSPESEYGDFVGFHTIYYYPDTPPSQRQILGPLDGEADILIDIPDIAAILAVIPEFQTRAAIETRLNPVHYVPPVQKE